MPVLIKKLENEKVTIAIESNEASKQIDPHCCAMQIKSGESVVTVNHIPREISRHCYFVLKEEREEGVLIDLSTFIHLIRQFEDPSGLAISKSEVCHAL